jgi:hypothetical protein
MPGDQETLQPTTQTVATDDVMKQPAPPVQPAREPVASRVVHVVSPAGHPLIIQSAPLSLFAIVKEEGARTTIKAVAALLVGGGLVLFNHRLNKPDPIEEPVADE